MKSVVQQRYLRVKCISTKKTYQRLVPQVEGINLTLSEEEDLYALFYPSFLGSYKNVM
jgi:hypothetical protein